jgi:3-hydroxyisobutyrate dehydrogenase
LTRAAAGATTNAMTEREIAPGSTRVGWIGTGLMGASLCGHLLTHGYELCVFTRTRTRAEPLLARGAAWADSPRALAARVDVVFTMVGTQADVRQVVLGEDGVLAGAASGAVLVDMTTSEPALAREIADAARARGIASLDAPVSGGDVGAREARLSIMVGGDRDVFERMQPLFTCLARTIVHQGPAGAGQHTKMTNQILIATGMIGVCEALLYAYKAGLDLPTVLASVSGGAAGSWSLSNYAPRIFDRDFAPGFAVVHFLKDLGIALAEARRLRLALPGLALAEQLYRALEAEGHGASGIQALVLALARMSAVNWP